MVKFAASERKKLTGLCIGMIVFAAFVLVFKILNRLNVGNYIYGPLECSVPVFSIVAAGLGLAAAKSVQYECLLRAHEIMCLMSGIALIIPDLLIIPYAIWTTIKDGVEPLSREQAIKLAMVIFVLVLAALMFGSSCLICQLQTKQGLCCSGCCDYVGEEEEVTKPTPPSCSAVLVENSNFTEGPTLQNVPSEIATAPSFDSKVRKVVIGRRYSTEALGIEIGGGFGSGVPIFIAVVDEHGPAADKLRIGERIITINGASSERVSHDEFAQMLRASPQNVNLEVA